MTTRFNAKDEINYGVQGVKSGYEGPRGDLVIPSCGIEDVDVAMFSLFDLEIAPLVGGQNGVELKKVPVVFAAGEKWALLKKGKPLRDKSNTLILPIITITRQSIEQSLQEIATRGINQQTGELVVRRRLDRSDRDYQNLINKYLLPNQATAAVSGSAQVFPDQVVTNREVGSLANQSFVREGALLISSRKNNIFETFVVPAPQFYSATYEVTIWTQYTQHMNQIIEKCIASFLPQAQSWKLTTKKGYWFIARTEGNFNVESNFEDMSSSERFIKCRFMVKVPAYIWASSAPGIPVPIKRYVSSPVIEFTTTADPTGEASGPEEVSNNFILGSDDPTLPLEDRKNAKPDQRRPGWHSGKVQPSNSNDKIDQNDPALAGYPRGINPGVYKKVTIGNETKYVKVISTNPTTGETVYSASSLEGLKLVPPDGTT